MSTTHTNRVTADDREAILSTTWTPDGRSWLATAEEACRAIGATLGDVLSMRRHPRAVRARARAWAVLLDLGYSYPEIARGWCCDHSTVIDVVRVHEPEASARRTATSKPGLAKARESARAAAACG